MSKKKIFYVQTSGAGTPKHLYAPFIPATTAAARGPNTTVYSLLRGVPVVTRGEAEKSKLGTFPILKEIKEKAVEAGMQRAVCEQSCLLLGLRRGDFTEAAKIVGAATLNSRFLEAGTVLSF